MATPGGKLAVSLQMLLDLYEDQNVVAIKSAEINITHKERLIKMASRRKYPDAGILCQIPTKPLQTIPPGINPIGNSAHVISRINMVMPTVFQLIIFL
jgi:hypothetical protein